MIAIRSRRQGNAYQLVEKEGGLAVHVRWLNAEGLYAYGCNETSES